MRNGNVYLGEKNSERILDNSFLSIQDINFLYYKFGQGKKMKSSKFVIFIIKNSYN